MYYVVNARMPSDKAYGIQIAKMCEAFIEQGVELELCIPKTHQSHISLKEFYGLRVDVPTRTFAGPDWYDRGRVGFAISSLVFMTSVCFYLLKHGHSALVYTIDMDSYSYAPLALLTAPIAVEMHSPKSPNRSRFYLCQSSAIGESLRLSCQPFLKNRQNLKVRNWSNQYISLPPSKIQSPRTKRLA